MKLTGEDFTRSLTALNKVELKMSNTFSGIGKSDTAETTSRVMHLLARRKKITLSELQKMFWNDADMLTLERIIQTCERAKICRREFKGSETIIYYVEEKKDDRKNI